MSSESNIEWCDRTWEVTAGCTKVSSGCANCYAEHLMGTRMHGAAEKRAREGRANGSSVDLSLEVINAPEGKPPRWNGEIRLLDMNLDQPLRRRAPSRYFVNSRSDLFHPDVPFEYSDRVLAVMALCPWHRFMVLTKRPERMREYLTGDAIDRVYELILDNRKLGNISERADIADEVTERWPLENVWLGTSVEDQETANTRLPELLACPAAGRFVSAEPLLGAVDLESRLRASTRLHMCMDVRGALRNESFDGFTHPEDGREMTRAEAEDALWKIHATGVKVIPVGKCDDFDDQTGCRGHRTPGLDWVIVGGESGAGARPCNVAWVRSIKNQCQAAGVPVFVKQLGADPRRPYHEESCEGYAPKLKLKNKKGADPSEWPADLRVREVPDGLRVGSEVRP